MVAPEAPNDPELNKEPTCVPALTVLETTSDPRLVLPLTIKVPVEITLSIKLRVVTLTLTTLPLTYKLDAVITPA